MPIHFIILKPSSKLGPGNVHASNCLLEHDYEILRRRKLILKGTGYMLMSFLLHVITQNFSIVIFLQDNIDQGLHGVEWMF